jgi:hypothetical protein
MKQNIWIALALLVALIYVLNRTGSGYINEAFIGLCPPGQMPASYTATGGECTPYGFY